MRYVFLKQVQWTETSSSVSDPNTRALGKRSDPLWRNKATSSIWVKMKIFQHNKTVWFIQWHLSPILSLFTFGYICLTVLYPIYMENTFSVQRQIHHPRQVSSAIRHTYSIYKILIFGRAIQHLLMLNTYGSTDKYLSLSRQSHASFSHFLLLLPFGNRKGREKVWKKLTSESSSSQLHDTFPPRGHANDP